MKNRYINPDTKVLKVQTQQMIATSVGIGSDVTSTEGAQARGSDFFFLFDEEEMPSKSDDDNSWEDWEWEEEK